MFFMEMVRLKSKTDIIIIVLSLVGLSLMLYVVLEQYFLSKDVYVCDINSKFSCSYVSTSKYAYLFGIHVSVYGVLWFLSMILLKFIHHKKTIFKKGYYLLLIFGFLFSFYLQLIEFLVLKVYCVLCIITFLIITLILGIEIKTLKNLKTIIRK